METKKYITWSMEWNSFNGRASCLAMNVVLDKQTMISLLVVSYYYYLPDMIRQIDISIAKSLRSLYR